MSALDADDVNELATQLRNRDPQAEVTRHHLNRKHGIQTVTKALELNNERYDRELDKRVTYVKAYSSGPVPLVIPKRKVFGKTWVYYA